MINKRILLGICGSIAAYKSADLVRRLREHGAEVQVVMTQAATEFITPLTMQALSGKPVRDSLLDTAAEAAMGHIELARWADVVLVAPTSADFLSRLASGRADDLLSALCLACEEPIVVAPAMNQGMWKNAATQENVGLLKQRGIQIFGPASGEQACGEEGQGRMLEPEDILQHLADIFETNILTGARVLVSAGPTREPIDPVRFISNRSSGKMGFAVAAAAVEAGAKVTLVSGPVGLTTPLHAERHDVETAQQMHDEVLRHVPQCDIFISTAAVSDYRPQASIEQKMKKSSGNLHLEMQPTADILASVSCLDDAPFTVGFAAETERLVEYAETKLHTKHLDMIAANQVGDGQGFDCDENALEVIWPKGHVSLPLNSKSKLARKLVSIIAERYYAKNSA